MKSGKIHGLLKRQLKRSFGETLNIPSPWHDFLEMVNNAYYESDMDRNMLERSLELSSLELLQANSEMRAIFEVVPDIFFRVDAFDIIIDCKTGNTSDLFVPRTELLGRKIYDIPLASVADKFRQGLAETRQNRTAVTFEYSLILKDNEYFYEARMIPLLEDQAIVIIRNVTDRKNAENALKKSEEYYREITTNASDVIYIVDAQGDITYASPSAEHVTGYAPEELIGKQSLSFIVPEDRKRADKDFLKALELQEVSVPNSFRVRHKNGSEIIMEGVGKNLLAHPVIAGFVMNVRNVTDRKRAEAELQESEAKLQAIFDQIDTGILIIDAETRTIMEANRKATRMSGFSRDQVIGKICHALMCPAEKGRCPVGDLHQKVDQSERTLLHADGSRKDVLKTVTPIVIKGRNCYLESFIDISDRKRAEEALRESEKKYRLLTEKMSDIVWSADLNLKTTYVTPSVETVLGFTQEERMRQTVDQQFTSESLALGLEALAEELALEASGDANPERSATLLLEYCHKDGSTRWMETVMTGLRDERGKLIGLHGVSRDVTERKRAQEALQKSEERYRIIFENTATANTLVAEDTTILMANDNFVQLSGYSRQELEGKIGWTHFVHPDDLDKMMAYNRRRGTRVGSVPPSYEFRFVDRRGNIKNLLLSVSIIPGTTERIASLTDLTERKQLQTQLLQAQKMESVGRLAGGVAHDFNNMLSVIIGNTEMALKKVDGTAPLYRILQDVLNAGERSADLTRQLLAFARKQAVNPKILDLNDTITGMLKMLQRLIGENIDLIWHPGHNLWKVKMDPSQVDQLLANLAVNARDAIDKTGKISIETSNIFCDEAYCAERPEALPGKYVLLAISDNGAGMSKETIANIFEPFYTTKKEGQGTGLGLATVYGVVKQNKGFIDVYSEPGRGTTFKIYLPCYKDIDQDNTDEKPEMEICGGTETILIVEDEESVLKLTRSMLETLGYCVLTAGNKDQALELVGDYYGKIDLLLTDVVMPDMNGKELYERITRFKPGLKCLYMSGYTADVIAKQGILEEGIQFLSKPFSLRELASKIREVLEGSG